MVKNKAQDFFESEAEVGTGVIKIYTPRKYGHPGVPIFTWFWGPRREYRDSLLPAKIRDASDTGGTGSVSRHVKCK